MQDSRAARWENRDAALFRNSVSGRYWMDGMPCCALSKLPIAEATA